MPAKVGYASPRRSEARWTRRRISGSQAQEEMIESCSVCTMLNPL